jgi:phosphate transport system substrate-binding protein
MRRTFILVALMVFAIILASCGAPAAAPTTAPAAAPTMAPAAAAAASTTGGQAAAQVAPACTISSDLKGKLTSAGSSALLPLIQLASTQFQQQAKNVQLSVTAGGSGAGRSQVCKGQIDVGNSDVMLSDKEKTDLSCADATQVPVAIQAFGPVASKQGPGSVKTLSKAQLQGIFSGQTKNWKEVGGDDQQIVLVNRAKGSGTRANMAKYLFAGDDTKFATGASEEDNNETVLQTVKQTPGAISYLGFAYLTNPDIVAFAIDNVVPNVQDIQNGQWPIAAPGYSITKGQPSDLEAAFIGYLLCPTFQKSPEFAKLGFVPIAK